MLISASPTWCSIEPARGEKKVTSLPLSLCSFNWLVSRLARISSSEIFGPAGSGFLLPTCAFLQSHKAWGAVV